MHNRIKVYPCQAELWSYPTLNCLTIQWGLSSYYPELSKTTDSTIFLFERLMLLPDIQHSTEVLTLTRHPQRFITHTSYFHTSSCTFFPVLRQRPFHSTFTKTQDYKSFFSNWTYSGFEQQSCCNQWYSRQSFCFCVISCHMHRFVCTHLLFCLLPGLSDSSAALTAAHCACMAMLVQELCYEVPQSQPSLL